MAEVEVVGLTKSYAGRPAVDDVSFSVEKGEIFGILGPNGAGKTTTIEMIEGLRRPDAGRISVHGFDALAEPDRIKELIGVQLQQTGMFPELTALEALTFFRRLYREGADPGTLLEELNLEGVRNSFPRQMSGGQRQRLALAFAMINNPEILFLDEPTSGLDPQARANLWDIILRAAASGRTVLMTTHYMEEAERLCHRVAVIDYGKLKAIGATQDLKKELGLVSVVHVTADGGLDGSIFEKIEGVGRVIRDGSGFLLHTGDARKTTRVINELADAGKLEFKGVSSREADLEDVFFALTGRGLRE